MKLLGRKFFKSTVVAAVIFIMSIGSAFAGDLVEMDISHQPCFDAFLTWQAIQDGTDKKHGLDLDLIYFDSGMPQVEALPAKQWDVGALGAVPMIMAALRYESYMIGMAFDDAYNTFVLARPDSPAMKVKGYNPKYPEMFGSPETIKGKTILVTTVSSSHYIMSTWLKRLGLKDTDVNLLNMEQGQALAAFESGKGDFVVLFAPFSIAGMNKGWKAVANGKTAGVVVPLVLISPKEYADKNPEKVARFLKMYYAQVDRQQKEMHKQAKEYQKFMKDWAGMEFSEDMVHNIVDLHPTYTLEKNLEIFDASKGKPVVWEYMNDLSTFFTENKKFSKEEREKVMNSPFITDKFLKMAAEMK